MYVPHQIDFTEKDGYSKPVESLGVENTPKRYYLTVGGRGMVVVDEDSRTFAISLSEVKELLPYCVGGVISQPCVWGFHSDASPHLLVSGSKKKKKAKRGFVRVGNNTEIGVSCMDREGRTAQDIGLVYTHTIRSDGITVNVSRDHAFLLDGKVVTDFEPIFDIGREPLTWTGEWTDRVVYSRTKLEKRLDFVEDQHGSMTMNEDIIYTSENGVGAVFSRTKPTSVIPYDKPFDGVRGNAVWMLDGRAFHTITPESVINRIKAI